ncbi:MAG: hypothetical protein DI626_03075 [Micavibrio aeruginosavorus]|uniref:Uncharacterized protein n=1 Tax=Micavibrio aeruginosavorus TaxID=349221 RepID=A0A2W4ZZX7_9BACT|nr:MAG: hypothetical protein DI626_03075 [Micavibrio aeruginosavorus]
MSFEFMAPKGAARLSFRDDFTLLARGGLPVADNENNARRQCFTEHEQREISKIIYPYILSGIITESKFMRGDGVSLYTATNSRLRDNHIIHIVKMMEEGKPALYTVGCAKSSLIHQTCNFGDALSNMRSALRKIPSSVLQPSSPQHV